MAANVNVTMYASYEYHLSHCILLMKKMHRALLGEVRMDSAALDWSHTEHCTGMLLRGINKHHEKFERKVATDVIVYYGSC